MYHQMFLLLNYDSRNNFFFFTEPEPNPKTMIESDAKFGSQSDSDLDPISSELCVFLKKDG